MDPLSQLHDIQLPEPITWWPLAFGWYLLIASVFLIIFIVWKVWSRPVKRHLKREAVALLTDADFAGVSRLLRRIAVYQYPRKEVAGLNGDAWLAFLDKTGKTDAFTAGVGRKLVTAPYEPVPDEVDDALVKVVTEWINAQELR